MGRAGRRPVNHTVRTHSHMAYARKPLLAAAALASLIRCDQLLAQSPGLETLRSFEIIVQLNAWDDATGAGGGYQDKDGLSVEAVEAVVRKIFDQHRIPVLTRGAVDIPDAALFWVTVTLHRPSDLRRYYVFAVGISVKQPARFRTGAYTSFASGWGLGPRPGVTPVEDMPATVLGTVRLMTGVFADLFRATNPNEPEQR